MQRENKNFEYSISCFKKAIEINPKHDQAFSNYSALLSKLGDFNEAYKKANEAIKINKNNARAYYNRAIALSGLGYLYEAVENYNSAITLDPNFIDNYYRTFFIKRD